MTCLDAQTLGAFVEGTLDEPRRREVMEHLELCEMCVASVGAAAMSLREEGAIPQRPRTIWWLAAAASLTVVLLGVLATRQRWFAPSPIGTLVAAAPADRREIEPRLTGGFRWAEYRGPARDVAATRNDPQRLKLLGAAGDVLDRAAKDQSVESKHAAAIASLLVDDSNHAIDTLRRIASNDARIWSDLSAAYYANGRASDYPNALAAADRALEIDPKLAEARFNRALVLERMGLFAEASKAWDAYLQVDSTTAWAAEARAHLARLGTSQSSFQRDLSRLPWNELVGKYPQETRTWGEGPFLAEWAEGRTESLGRARAIGDLLAKRSNETLLRDAVAAIDRARDTRPLIEGHLAYRQGRIAYSRRELAQARAKLQHAAEAFARGGSPMALAARYFAANVVYDMNRPEEAFAELTQVLEETPAGHRALRAQILWQRALCSSTLAHWSSALADADSAHAIFDSLGERSNRAFMDVIIAEMLEYAEDSESAWHRRASAFEAFSRSGDTDRLIACLGAATRGEVRRGNDAAARSLASIEIEAARRGSNRGLLAVALFYRALLLHRSGEGDPMRDLAEARAVAPESGDARRVLAEIDFAEGVVTRAKDRRRAIELLSRSAGFFRESFPVYLPAALLERGRAYRDAGRLDAAAADFNAGVDAIEQKRASQTASELETAALFDDEQNLFGGLAELALLRGDSRGARAVAERALQNALRSRFPSARVGAVAGDDPVVEVYAAGDEVVIFCAGEAVRAGSVAAVREEARALVDALASRHSAQEVRSLAAALYTTLIAPVRKFLPRQSTLVFVSDTRLGFIPFPVLFDAGRSRFLIEDFAISVRPATALPLYEYSTAASMPALIVGHPEIEGAARLPDAEREARDVAAMYRAPTVFTGSVATSAAVVRALSSHGVFHYAGHAAAAARSPGALRLADGRLYASDIARLDLHNLELVVLAACRSSRAANEILPRDLATAFIVAGAHNVVGTGWEIDDATSASTFAELHRAVASGQSAASAVRALQLAAIRANQHPTAWAALTLFSMERSESWERSPSSSSVSFYSTPTQTTPRSSASPSSTPIETTSITAEKR